MLACPAAMLAGRVPDLQKGCAGKERGVGPKASECPGEDVSCSQTTIIGRRLERGEGSSSDS